MQPRADDGPLVEDERRRVELAAEDEAVRVAAGTHARDRWHWRRRIRASPHQHFVYRIAIAILGLMCIAAGLLTGPLPGPGGIPLVLLGLAIWASEFRWAYRLMMWCKAKLHQVRQLPPGRKVLFWVLFVACCGLLGYTGMLLFGLPGWLPDVVGDVLGFLPGVR